MMETHHGFFVVIDGIDGSGTTTQARLLAQALDDPSSSVLLTAEPSQGKGGKLIRELLALGKTLGGATMALLFAADRTDHVEREILPALKEGRTVVCCRYLLSSLAYHGQATGLVANWVAEINRWAIEPDLTVVLDVPLTVAAKRRAERDQAPETYENDVTLDLARRAYRTRIAYSGHTSVLVDANRPVDAVAADVLDHVMAAIVAKQDNNELLRRRGIQPTACDCGNCVSSSE